MSSGLHDVTVPVFARMLRNVSTLLDKMVADLEPRKVDPTVLLQSRLYPDMFPLLQQVQLACDFAKGASDQSSTWVKGYAQVRRFARSPQNATRSASASA